MKKTMPFITLAIFLCSALLVHAQPVIDDMQVNGNSGGQISQGQPRILLQGDNYLIIFKDSRGIFAQLFDATGTALTDNFQLEGAWFSATSTESFASAVSDSGNIIVVWRAGTSFPNIMAQLFNSAGSPIGENFHVSEFISNSTERFPAVACGDSGQFIITWDETGGDPFGDIFVRRFSHNGTPLGGDFMVNDDDLASTRQQQPDIASNGDGGFIITWHDYRRDFNWGDIYGQRYDRRGTKIGINFKVNDEGNNTTIMQRDPVVAVNDSGYFVIAWRDSRENSTDVQDQDIYVQRYDPEGNTLSDNFKVNDNPDTLTQTKPGVAINDDGDFLVAWSDGRNDNNDIYAQYYQREGTPSGDNIRIDDDEGDSGQTNPVIAADQNGNFLLAWSDNRSFDGSNFVHLQKMTGTGSLTGDNFRTSNQLLLSTFQEFPCISVDNSGGFIVCWRDERANRDIYARAYSNTSVPHNSEFRVNDDESTALQNTVSAAVNDNGIHFITWQDGRNGESDIYGQLYTTSGSVIGSNFMVNDDTVNTDQMQNAVASTPDNNFIVVWRDTRNEYYDIYARRFNESGTALGADFKVNDDLGDDQTPSVAVNDSGKILIAWADRSHVNDIWGIYLQLYTSEGIAIGSNFNINDNAGGEYLRITKTVVTDSGNFVVAWQDYTNKEIIAQRVADDRTLIGSNFELAAGSPSIWNYDMAANESGNFVVAWYDSRNQIGNDARNDIFARRYDSDGTELGSDFKVSTRDTGPNEYNCNVGLHNNRIYTTWRDTDRSGLGTGTDIWTNILDWDNPVDNISDPLPVTPEKFALNQNYPNPFNPETVISWQLAIGSKVKLTVYDIRGREVKTLFNDYQPAGQHEVVFNASSLASGVYVYQLETDNGFTKAKKLLLLR